MLDDLKQMTDIKPINPAEFKPRDKTEKEYTSADYLQVLYGLGYRFRMRELDDKIEIWTAKKASWELLTDAHEATVRRKVRDLGLSRVNVIRDVFISEAEENNRYHPVRDYFVSLSWDGIDHISKLASYFCDEHDLFKVAITRWLVGAVAKAYKAEQNRVLVLDSQQQGIGKSFFAKWICPLPDYFYEGQINPDDKDDNLRLMNRFIWEVTELGSTTRRADVEALKAFVTRQVVTIRVPYGKNDIVKPALASFVGTINDLGGFLNDPTGNRRYMAVRLNKIDWDYSKLDVNKIWAQAVQLYQSGEPWQPQPNEIDLVNQVNHEFQVEDPLQDIFLKGYDIDSSRLDWFTATLELREYMHAQETRGSSPTHEARMIASALKEFNLKRTHTTPRGYYGIKKKNHMNQIIN